MERVIIHLDVPAIRQEYDVSIPLFLKISELTGLIVRNVEDVSEGRYITSGGEELCHKEKYCTLDRNKTAEEYGIRNGDHIVLI